MNRRTFILQTAAASAGVLASTAASAPSPIVDCNASLGEWPFRRLLGTTPAALATKLRTQGCAQAWVTSLEALLHRDITAVNARLAERCMANDAALLKPVGSLHPKLPGWRDDLLWLLKDADALDRVRLGDLDPRHLRSANARDLIESADELYLRTRKMTEPVDVWSEAFRLRLPIDRLLDFEFGLSAEEAPSR